MLYFIQTRTRPSLEVRLAQVAHRCIHRVNDCAGAALLFKLVFTSIEVFPEVVALHIRCPAARLSRLHLRLSAYRHCVYLLVEAYGSAHLGASDLLALLQHVFVCDLLHLLIV
jgi:hypothetical protein